NRRDRPRPPVPSALAALPALGDAGVQPEWAGKRLLAAAGIAVPAGRLAASVAQAREIAQEVGYPVALKAQGAALAHTTEAGGVLLGITDASALEQAWEQLQANLARVDPPLRLDGVLVE